MSTVSSTDSIARGEESFASFAAASGCPVAETVASFDSILKGELDEVPEQAFLNVGGVEQVLAKAKALQEG